MAEVEDLLDQMEKSALDYLDTRRKEGPSDLECYMMRENHGDVVVTPTSTATPRLVLD